MCSCTSGRLLPQWHCRCEVLVRPIKHAATRRSLGNERGLALVITLFVVALVAVLVLEYHFDASVELDLAANYASDVQAYHLAMAGVRFAQALLQQDDPKTDGPDDLWYKLGLVPVCFAPQQLLALAAAGAGEGLAAGGSDTKGAAFVDRLLADASPGDAGCIRLRITDEDSKLPINALWLQQASPNPAPGGGGTTNPWVEIFKDFFVGPQGFFKTDPEVLDALLDWMTPSARRNSRSASSYYERLPVPYKPPVDGRMRTPGELRLVKGLDNPEELAKLFPGTPPEALADIDLGSNAYLTTAWADDPNPLRNAKVNVNTAMPEVILSLFRGSPATHSGAEDTVRQLLTKREQEPLTQADLGTFKVPAAVAGIKSTYFRIESVGVVGNVRKKIVTVLKRPATAPTPP